MIQFLQSARALVGLVMLVFSVFLSFKGFPLALLSWLGGGVVLMGYSVAIATITHEDTGQGKEGSGSRFLRICVAFAVASLGAAMVRWGGLWSISIGNFTIPFRETGILFGIAGGLWNIDKTLYVGGQPVVKKD